MKIALASDHRGFKLKKFLLDFLKEKGYTTLDFGTYSTEPCDYPDYVYLASKAVRDKEVNRAIVICYTGIGSCIVANKVRGIRAALVNDLATAVLSRKHNDSNVLVLSARNLNKEKLKKIILKWLKTEFEGGRHLRRINKIRDIEEAECLKR